MTHFIIVECETENLNINFKSVADISDKCERHATPEQCARIAFVRQQCQRSCQVCKGGKINGASFYIYIYIYILKGKRLIIDEANLNNKIYFRANDASGTMCEAYATARNCNENVFVQKRCKKSCGLCRKCHNLSYMMHYILLIFILLENLILGNILMPIIFYSLNQGLPFQKRSTSTSTV